MGFPMNESLDLNSTFGYGNFSISSLCADPFVFTYELLLEDGSLVIDSALWNTSIFLNTTTQNLTTYTANEALLGEHTFKIRATLNNLAMSSAEYSFIVKIDLIKLIVPVP